MMILEENNAVIGQSPKLQQVLRTTDLVSATDVPVLIIGETGTGKDLFASRIHSQSQRKQRPFIKVSCSSLRDDFTENMLFDQKGYIKQASSGTLFLDEISELPEALQNKLLHFIETSEVTSTGKLTPKKYDVRIIVATDKHLGEKVKAGTFRADLFYRLNVIPIELPALKDRENDSSLLIDHFFRQFVHEKHLSAPNFTKAALKQILRYNWPGNIRELHNFCERMFILFSAKTIDVLNLPREFNQYAHQSSQFSLPSSGIKLDLLEVDLIQQAMETTGGNKSRAARLLGLTRDTFLYRLKKHSISV